MLSEKLSGYVPGRFFAFWIDRRSGVSSVKDSNGRYREKLEGELELHSAEACLKGSGIEIEYFFV